MKRTTEKVSTLEKPIYLHSLEAFTEFEYEGKRYRTINCIKASNVTPGWHRTHRRDVLDLQTGKAVRLPFFTEITVISRNNEN